MQHQFTWDVFVALMTRCAAMPPIEDKHAWPLWSPTLYSPGASRGKKNVQAVSMLVLDQDSGVDWEQAIDPFHRVQYLVHTSYSHTKEVPKFRIILPLAQPIAGEDWPLVWSHLTRRAVDPDPACKDASRVYFLPSRPPGAASYILANQSAHCGFLNPDVEAIKRNAHRQQNKRKAKPIPYHVSNKQREIIEERGRELDPGHRRMIANQLGARLSKGYAGHIRCPNAPNHAPGKNKDSVWFRLDPGGDRSKSWANCNHRNTCQWYGRIGDLI